MNRLLIYITITLLLLGCASPTKVMEQLKAMENSNSNKTTVYMRVCPDMQGLN